MQDALTKVYYISRNVGLNGLPSIASYVNECVGIDHQLQKTAGSKSVTNSSIVSWKKLNNNLYTIAANVAD